jgi:hypothetical protein
MVHDLVAGVQRQAISTTSRHKGTLSPWSWSRCELCLNLGDVADQAGGVALLGRNDLDAVGESDTSDDLRQLICAFQSTPGSGRRIDQFEHHQPGGLRRQRSLGPHRSVPHRGEHALDRIGGPQVDPVLGREVAERQ